MNKKGMITLTELIALILLIPALIFIYYSYNYVASLFEPPELDQRTIDNFKVLVREIKDLQKDLELKETEEKARITVPLVQQDSIIIVYNYKELLEGDLNLLPKKCRTKNCICLFHKDRFGSPTEECYELNNIYFEKSHTPIKQVDMEHISIFLELTKSRVSGLGDYRLKIEKV